MNSVNHISLLVPICLNIMFYTIHVIIKHLKVQLIQQAAAEIITCHSDCEIKRHWQLFLQECKVSEMIPDKVKRRAWKEKKIPTKACIFPA